MHLIHELGGVETGYRFSFYTYGPYSVGLAGDLDIVARSGGAKFEYDNVESSYSIEPARRTGEIIKRGIELIEQNRESIDKVLDAFGGRSARDMELVSTTAYLHRHLPREEFEDNAGLQNHVRALKPKYSEEEIKGAILEVKEFLSGKQGCRKSAPARL